MPPKNQQQPASQPDPVAEAAESSILDAVGSFFGDPGVMGAMQCMTLVQNGAWPTETRSLVDEMCSRYVEGRARRELGELHQKIKAADKAKAEAEKARKAREAAEKTEAAAAARKADADAADAAAKKNAEKAKAEEAAAAAKLGKAVR